MRTSLWMLTSMFAVTLAACGDDKNDTDTTSTTVDTTTPGTTSTDPTTGTTAEPTTSSTTTTTDPVTTDPVTTTTTDPVTTDATTTTTTGDPVELTCENYCALYASGCSDFSEYANNNDICLAQCAQWPLGIAGETAGDSLGCRLYHVGVANQTAPDLHCPHAGPTGDGVCVDADAPLCADYCATYLKNCVDKLNLYKDEADCLGQCAAWYPGKDGDVAGDTVGCREYHAGVALGDPMTHCPHAGPGGAMVCVAG